MRATDCSKPRLCWTPQRGSREMRCLSCRKASRKSKTSPVNAEISAMRTRLGLECCPVQGLPLFYLVETITETTNDDSALVPLSGGRTALRTRKLIVASRQIRRDSDDSTARYVNDRTAAIAGNKRRGDFDAIRTNANQFTGQRRDHAAAATVSKDDDRIAEALPCASTSAITSSPPVCGSESAKRITSCSVAASATPGVMRCPSMRVNCGCRHSGGHMDVREKPRFAASHCDESAPRTFAILHHHECCSMLLNKSAALRRAGQVGSVRRSGEVARRFRRFGNGRRGVCSG